MSHNLPHVAVVILSWNGKQFLEEFIPPLLQTTYPNASFYVADNASTDDSIAFLEAHYPQVNIIRNPVNEGFAGGYNMALDQVTADYYVLLNQDVAVTPGWIEPVVEMLTQDDAIGAAQPKLRAYHQQDHFEYAGAAGGYIDRWGFTFCRGRLLDVTEKDNGQYDTPAEIFWGSGACLFIKAGLYHALGGLDSTFFAHMEEIDLCWRVKRAGYKIVYCPESVVYHVGGGSLPQGNPRKTYLNFRNNLSMLVKNLEREQLFTILPVRLALDVTAAYASLFMLKYKDYWAVAKAHWYFFTRFPQLLQNRKLYNKLIDKNQIDPPNRKGTFKGSLVVNFFLKGKKRFSQLAQSRFL